MLRFAAEGIALFLLPFVVYAAVLLAGRRFPIIRESWSGTQAARLAAAGLVLAILGLLALGLFAPRHRGIYVPAHMEDGQLVPGRLE